MSDQSLQAAYQAHVGKNTPANREGCPTADELNVLAASGDVGDNSAQTATLEHVLSCAVCRPEFELLRAANVAERAAAQAARTPFTQQRIALAATLLLAVGIGGEAWRRSQVSLTRATPADGSDVVLVSPASKNAQPVSGKFVWRAVSGAVAYQLEVLDSAGTAVVQATTADTTVHLSTSDSLRVAALPVFDWMVTARRSDGNERRSALTRVR